MAYRISQDCFFVKMYYKFSPADNICLTSSPCAIIWLDSLHRNNQMCRLKFIYEESVSVCGAGCIQLLARNKGTKLWIYSGTTVIQSEKKVSSPIFLKLMEFHISSRQCRIKVWFPCMLHRADLYIGADFCVLLTVHLNIILVINQRNAQTFVL